MSEGRVTLPGQRLRTEREARGMSAEDVAGQLNLTISYLKALEVDDYERLPEATFIRGYIRNYARLLGIPSEELTHTFDEVMEDEASDEREQYREDVVRPRRRRSGMLGLMAAGVVLLAGIIYLLMGDSDKPEPDVAEPAAEVTEPSSSAPAPDQAAGDTAPVKEPATGAEPEAGIAGQTGAGAATAAEETAEPREAVPDTVIISFNESCWVEVTNEAGETVFAGQKQADERLSLEAVGPLRIKFGNAAAVSLITVNGDVVSMPSSAPGDVVRLTVP